MTARMGVEDSAPRNVEGHMLTLANENTRKAHLGYATNVAKNLSLVA